MNLRITTGILLILGVFQFLSCRKQNLTECKSYLNVVDDTTCYDLDVNSITDDRYFYRFPCMNPNNNDEFVFYYEDRIAQEHKIMKYSFSTGESSVIAETPKVMMPISYSSQGWIAYTCYNGPFQLQLRILKDDGSIDQVFCPDNFFNVFPIWDEAGEYLYWTKLQNPDPNRPTVTLRKHVNGSAIDTVEGDFFYDADFLEDRLLTARTYDDGTYYGYYDFANNVNLAEENFHKFFLHGAIASNFQKWSKAGGHFFSVDQPEGKPVGLYKFSIDGHSFLLKKICASKRFETIDVALNDEFLVATKIRQYLNPPSLQNVRYYSIWTIDLTTGEEKQVVPY